MNNTVPPSIKEFVYAHKKAIIIGGIVVLIIVSTIVARQYGLFTTAPLTPVETLKTLKESSLDIPSPEDRERDIKSLEGLSRASTVSSEELLASLRNVSTE